MTHTVLIADDHALIRRGMRDAITALPGVQVVGTVADGITAVAETRRLMPDLIVLDMSMPGLSGIEAFAEIRRWSPDTKVAIVTGNPTAALFVELEKAGVDGLFVKSCPIDELCNGLLNVLTGRRVVSEDARALLDVAEGAAGLSVRELQVLQGVGEGLNNTAIAERLTISPKTVDKHRTSLMRKLDVSTSAALIVKAAREGLVDL
ncbi:MAG: response regulator transcription factor [Pseudomonadota bacterium]